MTLTTVRMRAWYAGQTSATAPTAVKVAAYAANATNSVVVSWTAGTACGGNSQCSFQSWQVQQSAASGSYSDVNCWYATAQTCTVLGAIGQGVSYTYRVAEACSCKTATSPFSTASAAYTFTGELMICVRVVDSHTQTSMRTCDFT